jgi:hypothetical protein
MGMGMGQPVVGSRSINRRGSKGKSEASPSSRAGQGKRHEHGYGAWAHHSKRSWSISKGGSTREVIQPIEQGQGRQLDEHGYGHGQQVGSIPAKEGLQQGSQSGHRAGKGQGQAA